MALDISTVTPAPGAGKMTPEQLLSPAWRHYGERVLLGAGLLDQAAGGERMHSPAWRDSIDLFRLNMRWDSSCILGQLYGTYSRGAAGLGFSPGEKSAVSPEYQLGFNTCSYCRSGCDPVAAAYTQETGRDAFEGLTEAWEMYLKAARARA